MTKNASLRDSPSLQRSFPDDELLLLIAETLIVVVEVEVVLGRVLLHIFSLNIE